MKATCIWKVLLAVLSMLALAVGQTAKADDLTVYNGTTTNSYVPAYIYYFDDFTKSQFVIPADSLVDVAGGTITSLTFYTNSSNIPYTTVSSANVYLMEVGYTSISAFEDVATNATQVYTGYLSIVSADGGGKLTITFATPFSYQGGNLLIGIENTENNGWKQIYFYGQNVTGASVAGSNDNSLDDVSATQRGFIPKTTITYAPAGVVILAIPQNLSYTPTPGNGTEVTLSWTQSDNATRWILQYGTDAEFNTYTEKNVSGTPSINLTGLTAEQTYYARVKAVDGEGNESEWSSILTFWPTLKTVIGSGTDKNAFLPTYTYYNYSLTQQIYTASELNASAGQAIYSVDFYSTGARTRSLDIYLVHTNKSSFGGSSDWIAVSDDDKVYSGDVTFAAGAWTTIEFDKLFIYDGSSNIAFVVNDRTGSYESSPYFMAFDAGVDQALYTYNDDESYDPTGSSLPDGKTLTTKNIVRFMIAAPPTCYKPKDLALAANPTYNSARLQWTPGSGDQTAWDIAYKAAGAADFTIVAGITSNPYTLTGLTDDTEYTVKVRGNCGGGDVSDWTQEITFITAEQYPSPTDLMADNVTPHTADISWTSSAPAFQLKYAPLSNEDWIYYNDDESSVSAIGTNGGNFGWGVMFPAGSYSGNMLSHIMVYDYEAMEGTLYVFNDGVTEPSNQLASMSIALTGSRNFAAFDFGKDLALDNTKNLWVVVTNESGADYPAAYNGSTSGTDPNSRWIYYQGGWYDIADLDGNNNGWDCISWKIRAQVYDSANPPTIEWITVANATSPCTLTNLEAETIYTVRMKAVYESGESKWVGLNPAFETPEDTPMPFDVEVVPGSSSATFSWNGYADQYNVMFRKLTQVTPSGSGLDEDFENGLGDWTVVRNGNGGTSNTDWHLMMSSDALSGDTVIVSRSWYSGNAYDVDNWLISPAVELDGALSYWVRDDGVYHDHYDVYVSTTTNDISSFELLYEPGEATDHWIQHVVDLSSYSGQMGYIAFRHTDYDQDILYIDDVKIGTPTTDSWKSYGTRNKSLRVLEYLEPGTTYEFIIQGYKDGGASASTLPDYFTTLNKKMPGDLNDDATVSVSDVTATVNLIQSHNYDEAADMDGDNDVDEDDLSSLVEYEVLGKVKPTPNPTPVVSAPRRTAQKAAPKATSKVALKTATKNSKIASRPAFEPIVLSVKKGENDCKRKETFRTK